MSLFQAVTLGIRPKVSAALAGAVKRSRIYMRCYTGFTYRHELLRRVSPTYGFVDVLVDGPFIEYARHSSAVPRLVNQRLVDVAASRQGRRRCGMEQRLKSLLSD